MTNFGMPDSLRSGDVRRLRYCPVGGPGVKRTITLTPDRTPGQLPAAGYPTRTGGPCCLYGFLRDVALALPRNSFTNALEITFVRRPTVRRIAPPTIAS